MNKYSITEFVKNTEQVDKGEGFFELETPRMLEVNLDGLVWANQKERIRIPTDRIRRYFPKGCTHAQMEDIIVKLCESYYKRRTEKER